MGSKQLSWVTIGLIGAGILLWSLNWWANRPLFLDEANIARNLFDRSFGGLFLPLDHRQYAPPLYLVLTKLCGTLFGYTERSLRIPAMLGGLLTVYGLLLGGRSLKLGWWVLLPLALLFVNPSVLRYVGEVKPYALDMGIAAVIIGYGLRSFEPGWKWATIGAVAVWLSLPVVFVLAALGTHHIVRTCAPPPSKASLPVPPSTNSLSQESSGYTSHSPLRNNLLTVGAWLFSFAALYLVVLRPSVGSSYLNVYHSPYFFPIPGTAGFFSKAGVLLQSLPKLAFGHTAVAITTGIIVALASLTVFRREPSKWLLLPLSVVIVASVFGFYSLTPRLLLFTLPCWWLLAARVSQLTVQHRPPFLKVLIIGLWLLIAGGTNVLRHYVEPETYSDARALAWEIDPAYQPVLHHGAQPAFDYYRRIHPEGPKEAQIPEISNVRLQSFPGKYVLLYDVLTQGNIRISVQQDSIWATERGCQVEVKPYFRAKALYIDCE